jgi:hypothetical protein
LPESISHINVSINWFIRKTDSIGPSSRYEPASNDALDDVDSFPALQIQIAARTRVLPMDRFRRRYAMRPESDAASISIPSVLALRARWAPCGMLLR